MCLQISPQGYDRRSNYHVVQLDKSVHIKIALGIKGSLMVCCFPPISLHYTDINKEEKLVENNIPLRTPVCLTLV